MLMDRPREVAGIGGFNTKGTKGTKELGRLCVKSIRLTLKDIQLIRGRDSQ